MKRLSPSKIGRLEFNLKYIALPIIVFIGLLSLHNSPYIKNKYDIDLAFFTLLIFLVYLLTILPHGVYRRAKDIFKKEPKYYLILYYYFTLAYIFANLAIPLCCEDCFMATNLGIFILTLTPYILRASKVNKYSKEDSNSNKKIHWFTYFVLFLTAPVVGFIISNIGLEFITFLAMFLKNILSH